ncbi:putative extracellular signal-regulated kinase 1, partial [Dunaliella salina]
MYAYNTRSNLHFCCRHVSDAARVVREIKLLRLLQASPDVVHLRTILLPHDKRNFTEVVLVFELMEADLHQVIKLNHNLQPDHHQWFLFQMLRAVSYMHQAAILHRDLKPRNMLLNSDCKLKICDLGLARTASPGESSEFWTDYVATRWYRAPELCGSFYATYTPQVDVWSIGCVFAEILLRRPLFMGKDVVHQLQVITDVLGTPPPKSIAKVQNEKARKFLAAMPYKPGFNLHRVFYKADPRAVDLLKRLLTFDPDERISAVDALHHPYFDSESDTGFIFISSTDFAFDESRVSVEQMREIMYMEIYQWHPHLQ